MSEIKTFDCEGCRGHCYGGYHMEECKDGYGDWVRKEDHEAAVAAALEEAAQVLDREAEGSGYEDGEAYRSAAILVRLQKSQ